MKNKLKDCKVGGVEIFLQQHFFLMGYNIFPNKFCNYNIMNIN